MSKQAKKRARRRRRDSDGPSPAPVETPVGPERVFAFADELQKDTEADGKEQDADAQWETWVTFRLAGEVFAFTVDAVREIVRVGTVTRVPHAPYPVRGIISLRGRVVPVVDLRVRISLPRADVTSASRILVASHRDRLLGLLVDGVEQVVRVDRTKLAPPPSDVMTSQSEYIVGVIQHGGTLLILLDSERVLLVPEGLEPAEGAEVGGGTQT